MEIIMTLVIMAVLIQGIVEAFKKALCRWDVIALALGAVLCPLAGIDAFSILGIPLAMPYVGAVLTGALVGRGAAFVFDLWDRIKNPEINNYATEVIAEDDKPPDDKNEL